MSRGRSTGKRDRAPGSPPPGGKSAGDIVAADVRSRMMRSVGQKNTKPELRVRHILYARGVRYRVSNRDLPGSPDIANRRRRWAVFVNGCFWHGHKGCSKTGGGRQFRTPVANYEYWNEKLASNRPLSAFRGFKVTGG